MSGGGSSWFQRYLLPGFAFKAVVIGGGYATGRELAEFFLSSGPRGGLMGMLMAMVIWSVVCAATFVYARTTQSLDYRTFFKNLLGPAWPVFEVVYFLFVVLILAVFGAAAGVLGETAFGVPKIVGTLALMALIALSATYGNASVERLFKWVSIFLYATYALFVVLALTKFGDRILAGFALPAPPEARNWVGGGLTYASYNIFGAVVILPIVRHFATRKEAVIAGLIAGPLAMIPAVLFFTCMVAFYPEIASATLPSDVMLQKLNLPVFHLIFQFMIFAALLESGTGMVHAINERVAHAWKAKRDRTLPNTVRLVIAAVLLVGSIFLADRFGLVALIAKGYPVFGWLILAIYVVPLLTWGMWRLWKRGSAAQPTAA